MIISLTFKDPDCSCITNGRRRPGSIESLSDDQQAAVAKFVEWSEYVTVRIDTTKGTATVVPIRKS